ncbi:hypothetical protein S140_49 [Shewanella sp. phage 1/40]|nr:hypothetical protein S140_49 [Shewanella sp. phage 1/40]AHK11459.1 hypothetical protein S140_49 [Shewanella sp. phage 1/40]
MNIDYKDFEAIAALKHGSLDDNAFNDAQDYCATQDGRIYNGNRKCY